MSEAYPLWRELERTGGVSLFDEVGLLCFGPREGEYVAGLSHSLTSQGVAHEVLRPEKAEARMPGLRLSRDKGAVFVPEAGWVAADAALRATYDLAISAGVEHIATEAQGLDAFDRIVVCAGPWVRRFWPEAPVKVTLQATAHVVADIDGPVWIEDGPDLLYGFPSLGPGAKVGVHRPGKEIDPDDPSRKPPAAMLQAILDFAVRRLGIEQPEIVHTTGCLYTVTPDEGFLFHPLDAKTLIVSACSGHGFKFGPWIGRRVAALLR
jgi:sarcosine oxidase